MTDISAIKDLLSSPKKIMITTHHKPDGDAIGSSLGLYNYLIQKNHHVTVVSPTDYPDFFNWMPGHEQVVIFTEQKEKATQICHESDLIFCLDFNHLSRIHDLGIEVGASKAKKIMIDHHLEPQGFEDYSYSNTKACATAELVYLFIHKELADGKYINKEIASCLYTGIMTDSGSFKFSSAGAEVYRIAADLIDKGADHALIQHLVYDNASENKLRFLGYALYHKLEILEGYHTALISIAKEDLMQFNIQTGDTEGLVNYALSIKGVKLAALIIDRPKEVKLSLRSIGDIPANEICKKYFNGGGHKNASGGSSHESLENTVKTFKEMLNNYKNILEN